MNPDPARPGDDLDGQDLGREVLLGPLPRLHAELTAEQLQKRIKDGLKEVVAPSLVLEVATLRLPHLGAGEEVRTLAQEHYPGLLVKFRKDHPKQAHFIAPLLQVIVTMNEEEEDNPELNIDFGFLDNVDIDWSQARSLLYKVHTIAERAQLFFRKREERLLQLWRANGLATLIVGAVEREIWRRLSTAPPAGERSKMLTDDLRQLEEWTSEFEQSFEQGAQHAGQAEYAKGVALGGGVLALLAAVLGLALWHWNVDAVAGMALPAGGLGAMISVMQRMHKGDLHVETAVAGRLKMFGIFRPLIGGVLGMVVFAILASELLLPAVRIPEKTGPALAFVALLGFLAGFNERFANDLVTRVSGEVNAVREPGLGGSSPVA